MWPVCGASKLPLPQERLCVVWVCLAACDGKISGGGQKRNTWQLNKKHLTRVQSPIIIAWRSRQ